MTELFRPTSVNENRQIAADKATIAADMLKDAWVALDDLKALEDLPLSFGHLIQVACSTIVDAVNTVKQLRAELPALPNGLSSRDVKRAEEMAAARVLEKLLRGEALSVLPPDATKAVPALLRSAPA
jgi:hypothetical protein